MGKRFPGYPDRKSSRFYKLNYNYSGFYFITVCTKNRQEYFGQIINNKIKLNILGKIVKQSWLGIPHHFAIIKLGQFVIMPNHVHGILRIIGFDHVGNRHACSLHDQPARHERKNNQYFKNQNYQKRQYPTIPNAIGSFKSSVTRLINKKYKNLNFGWQKSFHDRIIRNKYELIKINHYIKNNPHNWHHNQLRN